MLRESKDRRLTTESILICHEPSDHKSSNHELSEDKPSKADYGRKPQLITHPTCGTTAGRPVQGAVPFLGCIVPSEYRVKEDEPSSSGSKTSYSWGALLQPPPLPPRPPRPSMPTWLAHAPVDTPSYKIVVSPKDLELYLRSTYRTEEFNWAVTKITSPWFTKTSCEGSLQPLWSIY